MKPSSDPVSAPIRVAVFGVSTHFAYWGFHLVREIVGIVTGETLHVHVTSLQTLQERLGERDDASVVVTSDFPDADLMEFLLPSPYPLIVFADSNDEFAEWTAYSRKISLQNAVRFCSNIVCVLTPAFLTRRALVLDPQIRTPNLVEAIVAHLFSSADEGLALSVYETLAREGRLPLDGPPDWRLSASFAEIEVAPVDLGRAAEMKSALASYASVFARTFPAEIVWPVAMFTCPDSERGRAPIELTGPARIIMYGPYLHLPAGQWTARVEFEIDGAESGVEAATDVLISEVLVEKLFVMPRKGIFAYELAFSVSDPRRAVEIRLSTRRSAIEGRLLVRSVVVRAI